MSVFDVEIIPCTTVGLISDAFNAWGTITITAGVLAEGEGVVVQYSHDGSTWQNLYINGMLQEITPTHSILEIHGPIKFRCVKSVTKRDVSVVLWRTEAEK